MVLMGVITTGFSHTVLVKSDARLEKLKAALPAGWTMSINGDTLKIENATPVWVLESNYINAPLGNLQRDMLNMEKIKKNGTETRASFVFVIKATKLLPDMEKAKANYFSKYYALFEFKAVGVDTPYARYYPYDLEEEAASIYNVLLREHLKTGIGPVYPAVDYGRP